MPDEIQAVLQLPPSPTKPMSLTPRSYTAGTFFFSLDGSPDQSYIKSVDGGAVKGTVVEERVGPDETHFKHLSTVEIEPVSLELGMSISRPFLQWIQDSWGRQYSRRNGMIVHADYDDTTHLEQHFEDALITETVFPALDGADKSSPYLNVKLQPEKLLLKQRQSGNMTAAIASQQKLWSASNFMFSIDGLDCTKVSKIDSFSVKQKIKQLYIGSQRHPEIEPLGIEFSNITIYVALAHAKPFLDWHEQFVVKGGRDLDHEKMGAITYIGPRGQELLTVELKNVGIFSLTIEKAEANAESIKRCKIELYVEKMALKPQAGFP